MIAADALERFSALAERYARCRPTYPDGARDCILALAGLGPSSLLVDVASGTGISSRLFADVGVPVLGIEPNAAMRAEAEREPPGRGAFAAPVTYRAGRAEATGLEDDVADAVLAAQAFHWFDAPTALTELRRILRPGGWLFLVWNERDERDPFTWAYGDIVRSAPDAARVEGLRARAGAALLETPLFVSARRAAFTHQQVVDEDGFVGRALSASYAPKEPEALAAFTEALRRLFAQHAHDGVVRILYETTVYAARKPL